MCLQELFHADASGNSGLAARLSRLEGGGGGGKANSVGKAEAARESGSVSTVKDIAATGRVHGFDFEGGLMPHLCARAQVAAAFGAAGDGDDFSFSGPEEFDRSGRIGGAGELLRERLREDQ